MALVTRIIGDCPSCGQKDSYGNVMISNNQLHRGCLHCKKWDSFLLPQLNKKVIYLDQFFYSHAFRGENKNFIDAKRKIEDLARDQIIVSPYSNLHEDESLLWTEEQRGPLFEFIKQTSFGHSFWPEYHIKKAQIINAFERFVAQGNIVPTLDRSESTPKDVNAWDDYFWIDVGSFKTDPAVLKNSKDEALKMLLDAFEEWSLKPSSFDEDVTLELMGGVKEYLKLYIHYQKRLMEGDVMAVIDSPIDSMIVENLMASDNEVYSSEYRTQRLDEFFHSPYYANIPHERISAEFFALLRHRLRQGSYKDPAKATRKFKGFMFDVRHIATYAPYCDAMVVDTLMHSWAMDPLINLTGRYGTRFFSRTNWSDFISYLDELGASKRDEITNALSLVHPKDAKSPNWSNIS